MPIFLIPCQNFVQTIRRMKIEKNLILYNYLNLKNIIFPSWKILNNGWNENIDFISTKRLISFYSWYITKPIILINIDIRNNITTRGYSSVISCQLTILSDRRGEREFSKITFNLRVGSQVKVRYRGDERGQGGMKFCLLNRSFPIVKLFGLCAESTGSWPTRCRVVRMAIF